MSLKQPMLLIRIIRRFRLIAVPIVGPSPERESSEVRRLLLVFLSLALIGCRDPRAEANIAQAMIDVGTQIASMQQDYAILQHELDSLRTVVARQDTTISRLASLAGLPYQPR